ncbi:uncharacterized protein N7496_005517 [Penicillium cataractarum]|uniref:Uncharacterized protein n=1 Tax=Penicillium cataractarum TaxID=2100454 RepID=A0A9W9SGD5_9EURO|nr:uncharacterized protein N7496_005517 [Penicillium cataractarum]KAJ5378108.1 hypothetical protein N7496_005517 [Penicillium cataractarum]
MIVGEVIAVVACVAAVVSAYHDGNQLFEAIKKKWKKHRRPPALTSEASPTDLEWSLRRGREDILTEWNAHTSRLGRHFEDGDPLAREQMKDIVIELQSALLANLRENNADFDLMALVQASDRGRIKTITVFHNLYQRLTQAAPIPPPISFGPVPIDPASRLFYWINLIENQYLAQLPSSRYIQSRSSFPGARVLAGSSSGPQLDMLNFIRQVEEQAVSPQSRRSSGSRASFGSLLSGRRRSSVEAYSPRGESSSHFGSFGSGAGLPPMLEMPDQYTIVERPPEGSYGSVGAYRADLQDYIEQNQINRITAARLQQNIQRELAQQEMPEYTLPTEVDSRQHDSAPSSSGGDDMNYDPLTLEMTANPWIMDAGQTTTTSSRIDVDPRASDMDWTRTYTPEPIPEPAAHMHPLRTNIVDSRYLLGMETPWAEEFSPLENVERRRAAMMDTGIESRGFIPQLRPEETIRQEHYTSPRPHPPPSSRNRPNSQPGRLPQTNLRDPPTPVTTGTSPPIRTPISRPTLTPSISSTNSGTSSASSDRPPRNCWPPSNDNNYAGFCKGAWKFSSGLGGFKVHSEPKGYYSMVSKWRCATCFFEMPLDTDSRRNDPKVNTEVSTHPSTGIQYRWAFLAKSHMKCKRSLTGELKEPRGPFGCIFCCRELGGPVRALEGLDTFMRHLLEHRDCGEGALLERARCVVGRVAGVEEDFDVNIPPLEGFESS